MLVYYEESFEVVAKAIYLLNFTQDRLRARLQFGFFRAAKPS